MKKINVKSMVIAIAVIASIIGFNSCTEEVQSDNSYTDMELRNNKNNTGNTNNSHNNADMCACIESNYPAEELSDVEIAGLTQMREEEKLARDVYITLFNTWNQKVFDNISKAEQRHMDAVLCLLNKYDLTDPIGDNEIGVFTDDDLQSLYNTLVDQGNQSLITALTTGATIEDLDIFDLMELSDDIDNLDILAVFNELTKGSRNHMRGFISQLTLQNESYSPQYISQELFDSIINSDRERGGSICGDSGNGNKGNNGNKGKKGKKGNKGNKGNGSGTCDGSGSGNGGGNDSGNGSGNGNGNDNNNGNGNGNKGGNGNGNG